MSDSNENKRKNFLVNLFTMIENFNKKEFKKKKENQKEIKKEVKAKKDELKETKTTISDIRKQRGTLIKRYIYMLVFVAIVIIIITVVVILATQNNEQKERATFDVKKYVEGNTSFGSIAQENYFYQENILNDKIDKVEKKHSQKEKELSKSIKKQTNVITNYMDKKLQEVSTKQSKELQIFKKNILETIEGKEKETALVNQETKIKIKKLSKKIDNYKNAPKMKLLDGKIVFPSKLSQSPKAPTIINPISPLNPKTNNDKENNDNKEIEYETVEVDMSAFDVPKLTFNTGMQDINKSNAEKKIEFDLTTTLVRVTLINGIKAPTLDIGVKSPTPVLMSIEGIAYAANDQTSGILKGCLLRGVAIGNINTSRAEIFGTHLSCIFEGDSGDKYKMEHTFPKNEVWIKGEDGADGVVGLIVDSSGKILSKSAAIAFLQGLTNYFSAQNLVTGGVGVGALNNSSTSGAKLGTSMKSGLGTGAQTGFSILIKKYEELLGGYYPYIDVKGGRKNLTAVFGGGVNLVATSYKEAHLEDY